MIQRRGRRLQPSPVACREQAETRKDFLVIHCIRSISSRLDLALPLDAGGLGLESEVDGSQLLLTLNRIKAQVTSHPSPLHLQVLWLQVCDEATSVTTLTVVVTKLHTGGSGHRDVHH